jgi:hypothetical protein
MQKRFQAKILGSFIFTLTLNLPSLNAQRIDLGNHYLDDYSQHHNYGYNQSMTQSSQQLNRVISELIRADQSYYPYESDIILRQLAQQIRSIRIQYQSRGYAYSRSAQELAAAERRLSDRYSSVQQIVEQSLTHVVAAYRFDVIQSASYQHAGASLELLSLAERLNQSRFTRSLVQVLIDAESYLPRYQSREIQRAREAIRMARQVVADPYVGEHQRRQIVAERIRLAMRLLQGGGHHPGPRPGHGRLQSFQIHCASGQGRQVQCVVPGQIQSLRILRQYSQAACVEGRSYGFQGNTIIVKSGCRADFEALIR